MAYQPPKYIGDNKLAEMRANYDSLQRELNESNTALAPGSQATTEDLQKEGSRLALEKEIAVEEGRKLSEQWYGKGKEEETFKGDSTQISPVMRFLNKLSNPLYAIAGAAEAALGQGSKKGMLENISANVKEREGFGNILKRSGMPYLASMPIGFALDIMFDPLNWATAGTGALIPRVARGLVGGAKAGGVTGAIRGATKGATSRLIPLGLKTANILSAGQLSRSQNTLARIANSGMKPSTLDKVSATVGGISSAIAKRGAAAASAYDDAIGRATLTSKSGVKYGRDLVREGGPGYNFKDKTVSIGKVAQDFIEEHVPHGEDLVRTMKYSPSNWARLKRVESTLYNLADKDKEMGGFGFMLPTKETGDRLRAMGPEAVEKKLTEFFDRANPPGNYITDEALFNQNKSGATPTEASFAENMNDGVRFAKGDLPDSAVLSRSHAETMKNLAQESVSDATTEDALKIYADLSKKMKGSQTGIGWYDDTVDKLNEMKIGKTKYLAGFLDAYSGFISAFKLAKVGLSPSAHVTSIAGNTIIPALSGQNVANPKLLKLMKDVANITYFGKNPQQLLLAKILGAKHWEEYASVDQLGFSGIFSFSLDQIITKEKQMQEALAATLKQGIESGSLDVATLENLQNDIDVGGDILGKMMKAKPNEMSKAEYASWARSTDFDVDNVVSRYSKRLSDSAQKEAKRIRRVENARLRGVPPKPADLIPIAGSSTKVMNFLMNKPIEKFGDIDPTFRLANALHMTENGLSEAEMVPMSRTHGISEKDIRDVAIDSVTGEKLFMLTPEKATEIVGEMYLNYAAMPAAVKMLRSLPVIGAPFAAFTYGMITRTGKALAYNPAIFNKTNFILQELSGDKTPLEKEAMKTEYYSWFNDPGMVKLGFVKKYPVYANLVNMIPYYSMNMFTPSERKYNETLPDTLLSFLDKVPLLQDPAGQVMFDYFIQPHLLSDGQRPQGAFGNALYPEGATGTDKAGYALRALGDSLMPGAAGLAALPVMGLGATGDHIKYTPGYNYRSLANAIRGRSTLGIPTKDSPAGKSLRAIGSILGIKTYPMSLKYTEQEIKAKAKKK